ncbi:MAG TPA: thioredoxin [Gemmatimonadales bacterium]|jgi:thioredoxin 1|nr:thioredoxin [Gemmatimonadales bacterium]
MSSHTVAVTDATFAAEVDQAKGLVLVDFWATWCGPCLMIAPYLDQMAQKHAGKLKVAKLDVDANQQTAMRFNVRSIPTMMFFKDGKHVDTLVGANPGALEQKVTQHLA